MKKISFIGIGVMGKSMVRNLMKKGYTLYVYTRTKSKALEIIDEGAVWCNSVRKCALKGDAVMTMVGYPQDVENVYFGDEGILNAVKPGACVIDMTTTSPKLSERIYRTASEKGVRALDAPVSGGDVGAKNATLSIMVGGDKEVFERCLPLFTAMGKTIVYEGRAGAGQHTKMANQIALSGIMASLCEAMTYARAVGLDEKTMLETIKNGAAGSWQMENMGPRMLEGDFAPGFYIKHYIKDMKIAREESQAAGVKLEILDRVLDMYNQLEEKQLGNLGTQALIKYYE